ncbi:MAG: formate--tetrahydrofolate ligase [Candidatus Ozemobacteraceae bacterium]
MTSVQHRDIEIAQAAFARPIADVAADLGLLPGEIEPYGPYKAKITFPACSRLVGRPMGKLVLVSAMTPTSAGEGKTTITVGLADAFRKAGKKAIVCIREPSMGPCFGVKGGAAGGGQSQVIPMEDINLHFTGDLHAVAAAHNLLAAMIDNHLHHGNSLRIDSRRIAFRRVLDMNDRALRNLVIGLGGKPNGVPRETGFAIVAASEVMSILCLAESISSLKERLGNIVVGFNENNELVRAKDLKAQGAMAAILKDALKPNLVQTLNGTPALVHGGPFANISHGCNSIIATKLALRTSDVTVTEAGFGTDLGAEKFFDIKCRIGDLKPDAAVVVATIRALKHHGGVPKDQLEKEHVYELLRGFENLVKHIENIRCFGVPCVVAINRFASDTDQEIAFVVKAVKELGVAVAVSEMYEKGAEGGMELMLEIDRIIKEKPTNFTHLYPLELPLVNKINVICQCLYGAEGVDILQPAREKLELFEKLGYRKLPIVIVKTQSSLSDIAGKIGRPSGFRVTIREAQLMGGAEMIAVIAGDIMVMPGLPKVPAAENIDVDDYGRISGLF